MLEVKFFQVNGSYYAKARHDGNVVDTTMLKNVWQDTASYIKQVMTWGYMRDEITFVIDPTIMEDGVSDSILRDIDIYANDY